MVLGDNGSIAGESRIVRVVDDDGGGGDFSDTEFRRLFVFTELRLSTCLSSSTTLRSES